MDKMFETVYHKRYQSYQSFLSKWLTSNIWCKCSSIRNLSIECAPGKIGPWNKKCFRFCQNWRVNSLEIHRTVTYFWTICVVKHSEYNPRHRILKAWVMWRRKKSGQVVLQSFTEDAVKCQVWPWDVLFYPVVLTQLSDLSPQTI